MQRILNIEGQGLTELPALPEGLEVLYCDFNSLQQLPPLPSTLKELYCSHNDLTSLPPLPQGLERLNCAENAIRVLPPFPDSLTHINFSYNRVRDIPDLPSNLVHIECYGNPIEILPVLPYDLYYDGMEFEWKYLKEPFREWYKESFDDDIRPGERMATLRHKVNTWHEQQYKARARNTAHFLHARGLRDKVGYGPNALIASFLSGQPGTVETQDDDLRFFAGQPERQPLPVRPTTPLFAAAPPLAVPAKSVLGEKKMKKKYAPTKYFVPVPRNTRKQKKNRGKKHTRHGKRKI